MSARTLLVLILGSAVLAATAPASAHHSFAAEYDRNQKVTIVGTVDKLEWTNPHARLYVDAVDENGKVVHWDLELGPPNNLMRLGWRRDSLVHGIPITVEAFRSRKEKYVASVRKVKLADGREVFAGQAFDTNSEE